MPAEEIVRLNGLGHAPSVPARQTGLAPERFLVAEVGRPIVGRAFATAVGKSHHVHRPSVESARQAWSIGRALLTRLTAGHGGPVRLRVLVGNEAALGIDGRLRFSVMDEAAGQDGPPAHVLLRDAVTPGT